ncbi:hypothetical protein LR48_Vigan03g140600 [Vigna angularis]|uniref:Uncharacterized protein n=1 Tax=Phaseolus angularis TaxID=3914 RepID=A0A0L9U6I7_PHAAN|nr:hypothetical protein LR48_Vigan03g140600 [Vigna angularis]
MEERILIKIEKGKYRTRSKVDREARRGRKRGFSVRKCGPDEFGSPFPWRASSIQYGHGRRRRNQVEEGSVPTIRSSLPDSPLGEVVPPNHQRLDFLRENLNKKSILAH